MDLRAAARVAPGGGGAGQGGTASRSFLPTRSYTAAEAEPRPQSLTLNVMVRDARLVIEAGTGKQTALWLANVATTLYAAQHPHLPPASLQPLSLSDESDNPIFPSEILAEAVPNGATLKLDLLGPRLGLESASHARERTLWELYAYADARRDLVPIVLLFDASELALAAPPGVIGNFTGWRRTLPMHWWRGSVYRLQLSFPAGSQLVFSFVVGGETLLTPAVYPIAHDSQGNKLHWVRVAPVPPAACLDASYEAPRGPGAVNEAAKAVDPAAKQVRTLREIIALNQRALARDVAEQKLRRNGPELPVLSARIVGHAPSGPLRTRRREEEAAAAQERLLESDWLHVASNIRDVLPESTPDYGTRLAELKSAFARYHAELVDLFAHVAGGTPGLSSRGQTWSLLQWHALMQLCRVPDAAAATLHGAPLGAAAPPPPVAGGGAAAAGALSSRASLARLDRIVHAVLARRDPATLPGGVDLGNSLGARELRASASASGVGKAALRRADAWSDLNLLSRSEWLECLLRAAMLRYKNPRSVADHPPPPSLLDDRRGGHMTAADGTVVVPPVGSAAGASRERGGAAAPVAQHPNPALSLELLVRNHIEPYVLASAAPNSPLHPPPGVRTRASANPNELRQRLLGDHNVHSMLAAYSLELHALFAFYTGGAPASGLGLGVPGRDATQVGIAGGTGGANPALLPPTLLGPGFGQEGLLGLPARSAASGLAAVRASATIHLRELESLLSDYELFESGVSRARQLGALGIVLDGEEGTEAEPTLELLYPEFLELLARLADTGSQWSNLYVEQQRLIAAAIAAGTLNPLDKPPASMLIAAGMSAYEDDADDDPLASGSSAPRRQDDSELCERLHRLLQWLFPTAEEQAERRARLAAQQTANTASASAAAAPPPQTAKADAAKEEKTSDAKDTAKASASARTGKSARTAVTPKKPVARKK